MNLGACALGVWGGGGVGVLVNMLLLVDKNMQLKPVNISKILLYFENTFTKLISKVEKHNVTLTSGCGRTERFYHGK